MKYRCPVCGDKLSRTSFDQTTVAVDEHNGDVEDTEFMASIDGPLFCTNCICKMHGKEFFETESVKETAIAELQAQVEDLLDVEIVTLKD